MRTARARHALRARPRTPSPAGPDPRFSRDLRDWPSARAPPRPAPRRCYIRPPRRRLRGPSSHPSAHAPSRRRSRRPCVRTATRRHLARDRRPSCARPSPTSTYHIWLAPLRARDSRRRPCSCRRARPAPRPGSPTASAASCRPAPQRVARARRRRSTLVVARGRRRQPTAGQRTPAAAALRGLASPTLNPRYTFDQFVIGDWQPPRPRRRARGRRAARPGLQPALHLRAARARQDPPAALDRQLRRSATATG